jgi:hypothetical protein
MRYTENDVRFGSEHEGTTEGLSKPFSVRLRVLCACVVKVEGAK